MRPSCTYLDVSGRRDTLVDVEEVDLQIPGSPFSSVDRHHQNCHHLHPHHLGPFRSPRVLFPLEGTPKVILEEARLDEELRKLPDDDPVAPSEVSAASGKA